MRTLSAVGGIFFPYIFTMQEKKKLLLIATVHTVERVFSEEQIHMP